MMTTRADSTSYLYGHLSLYVRSSRLAHAKARRPKRSFIASHSLSWLSETNKDSLNM